MIRGIHYFSTELKTQVDVLPKGCFKLPGRKVMLNKYSLTFRTHAVGFHARRMNPSPTRSQFDFTVSDRWHMCMRNGYIIIGYLRDKLISAQVVT